VCTVLEESIVQDPIQLKRNDMPCNRLGDSELIPKEFHCRTTGDMGRWEAHQGLCYIQRLDRTVKFNGMKFDLSLIEAMAMETELVEDAICICSEENIYLFVIFKCPVKYKEESKEAADEMNENFLRRISSHIPLLFMPCEIISLRSFPLTPNGKFDVKVILEDMRRQHKAKQNEEMNSKLIHQISTNPDVLVNMMKQIWRMCTDPNSKIQELEHQNFLQAGGTSITAKQFSERAFSCLKCRGTSIQKRHERKLLETLFESTFEKVMMELTTVLKESQLLNVPKTRAIESTDLSNICAIQSGQIKGLAFMSREIVVRCESKKELSPFSTAANFTREKAKEKLLRFHIPFEIIFRLQIDMGQCVDASVSIFLPRK